MSKKKLYISCPMKGRTEENIRKSMEKMHRIAEIVFDQELEVIPTYTEDKPPESAKAAIWYLGRSIQLMADADYFIGIKYDSFYKGCNIERNIADEYGIKSVLINHRQLMPDLSEVERKYYEALDRDKFASAELTSNV